MIYKRMKDIRTYFDNTQIPKLNDFCNYYGISLDYICGLTNNKKRENIIDKIDKKIIGNNLKEIRVANNDTQDKTSLIINVDQSNYSKYELGKILIHTYPLIEFAKHYNVSIDSICKNK